MKSWVIEPRDTLVVRDGAPADSVMRSLSFPWPSSLAGLVRTRAGTGPAGFETGRVEELRALSIRGPILASLDEAGELRHLWAAAPQDCVWHPTKQNAEVLERRALGPSALPDGVESDLDGLQPVSPIDGLGALPSTKATHGPAFWRWDLFEAWLASDSRGGVTTFDASAREGLRDELLREARTHVAIAGDTLTASHGQLFETQGLRFADGAERFGMWIETDAVLQPGVGRLGGEGRLSTLRESSASPPRLPDTVREALRGKKRARVVLLTPGVFRLGHRPDGNQLGAAVVAAVVGRPLAQSGWDFAADQPKASRRLAPAGSVYWIETDDAERWAEARWMSSICDDAQDARDGFGLCVVGAA